MKAYERLLRYAAVDSQSDENGTSTPSTEKQFEMTRLLKNEMEAMGLERVYTDTHAYAYGFLPATPGREHDPVIGLIAQRKGAQPKAVSGSALLRGTDAHHHRRHHPAGGG